MWLQKNVFAPRRLPEELGNVVEIGAGTQHTLALMDDGKLLSWGQSLDGQLGRTDVNVESLAPVPVPGQVSLAALNGQPVSTISAGRVWQSVEHMFSLARRRI